MAGSYTTAVETLRKLCSTEWGCYSVTPTSYIYTQGIGGVVEEGFIVTLINFPPNQQEFTDQCLNATRVAYKLLEALPEQKTCSIEPYGFGDYARTTLVTRPVDPEGELC